MKNIITTLSLSIFSIACYAQSLKLSISNPQPRLGQSFIIAVNIDTLNEPFFHFLSDKFNISSAKNTCYQNQAIAVNAEAVKLGKHEIGPLKLEFNGVKYATNKIEFSVIDSLPKVNKGLWIRKVAVSDSEFMILIEQRIPTSAYFEKPAEFTSDEIANIKSTESNSSTEPQTIQMPDDKLQCSYHFGINKFTIIDKHKPVVFRKSDFTNLPDYYKFEDIVIN